MRQPSRVARRYASALFHIARRDDAIQGVAQDLAEMTAFFDLYPAVLQSMTVPRVPVERKKAALQALVGNRLSQPLTRRFLDLILDHGREASLPDVAAAYTILADEARNVITVYVTSAAPLNDEQSRGLKAKMDQLTGRDTRLETSENPALVGGLTVRVGDTIMDGSVRGYLEQFGNLLRTAPLGAVSLDDVPLPTAM